MSNKKNNRKNKNGYKKETEKYRPKKIKCERCGKLCDFEDIRFEDGFLVCEDCALYW